MQARPLLKPVLSPRSTNELATLYFSQMKDESGKPHIETSYKSLFPNDFSAGRVPQLPPSPSILQFSTSEKTAVGIDEEANKKQNNWFTVRHFLRPNTLFGFYEPGNREERLMAQIEKRNILQVLPRDILWHGNQLSKASSPAAKLLAQQKVDLEAFNRRKTLPIASTNHSEFAAEQQQLSPEPEVELTATDNLSSLLFAPRVLIQCRKNNILIAVTDAHSRPLKHWTSGMLGFKNASKTTQKAALTMMDVLTAYLQAEKINKIRLQFKGVNGVRQTILSQFRKDLPFAITHITDTTPLALGGGPRPKKARRL